ncbi:MAG: hypothetical protein B6I20_07820 [Bacteroidetes bacterium 4572_117]|nr:MAG: hypothetical protein B6I20_07820 [Bacteroidetes bacterium 4572_117]
MRGFKFWSVAITLFLLNTFTLKAQFEIWTVGTARTIPEGHLDVSVFRPTRYGLSRTFELSTHPLLFPVLPNAQVKKTWYKKNIIFASVHGLNYPSLFLNIVRLTDKPDLIPANSVVPQLFAFKNEIIISKILKKPTTCEAENYFLSLKLGVQFALQFGENTMPLIQKSILYPRTSIYHKKILWYVGADIDGHLNSFINFSVDLDFLSVGLDIEDFAVEHKAMLMAPLTKSLMILGGYKVTYGTYPSGAKLGVYPMFDISWKHIFTIRKDKELNLFKKKMF